MDDLNERDAREWEEGWAQKEELNELLRAHAAAWWGDFNAADYVENVNATYADYLAAGGDDAHYAAHWQAFSNEEREAAGVVLPRFA